MKIKTTPYFSHDQNALFDIKISKMRLKYGMEGYGVYWGIIEALRSEDDYMLSKNEDLLLILSQRFSIHIDKLTEMLNDFILKYGLFSHNSAFIWSQSLLDRMEVKENATSKFSNMGKLAMQKRWDKKKELATNATQENPEVITDVITDVITQDNNEPITINKLINKEIKEDNNNTPNLITPSLVELKLFVKDYCEKNYPNVPIHIFYFIAEKYFNEKFKNGKYINHKGKQVMIPTMDIQTWLINEGESYKAKYSKQPQPPQEWHEAETDWID